MAGVTASAPIDDVTTGLYWDLIVRAFDVRDGTVAWTIFSGFHAMGPMWEPTSHADRGRWREGICGRPHGSRAI